MSDTEMKRLNILSIGAGAVGTYIGGSLALQGHQVMFLEQPPIVEDLRERGMTLQLGERKLHISSPLAAESMDEALLTGPFDVALFALKSYNTQAAIQSLLPFRAAMPPILCLQNGVDNENLLEESFGKQGVIAATVTSAIGRRAAGEIILEKKRGTGIAASHELSHTLAAVMNQAGLNTRLYARAADMKWSKMLTNLLANATSAILNMTPAEIFANPDLCRLEVTQLREALKVMSSLGIHTVDLPGTPVVALTFAVRNMPLKISQPLLARGIGGGRGGKMPSFHVDLYAGREQSEVAYLNGAVVRYGEHTGVPTPVNRLLTETLLALTRGELALDSYAGKPDKLLAELEKKQPS
ncbi:MAG: ketopantoate reductase family protein [Anaerolineales bacterium]